MQAKAKTIKQNIIMKKIISKLALAIISKTKLNLAEKEK